eukprot:1854609-Rhodomonas_salina.1
MPRRAREVSSSPVLCCHCAYLARSTLQMRRSSLSSITRSRPRVNTPSSSEISAGVNSRESVSQVTGGTRCVPRWIVGVHSSIVSSETGLRERELEDGVSSSVCLCQCLRFPCRGGIREMRGSGGMRHSTSTGTGWLRRRALIQ